MKKILWMTCLIIISCCHGNKGKNIQVSETDYKQASVAFTELKEALTNEKGKLWNFKMYGPVLLIDRKTHLIIANEPDAKGDLVKYNDWYVGLLPENRTISNTAVDWNGKRWTMVAFPLPELKEERLNILIHESFHRIQPSIGFDSLTQTPCSHLDTKEGRIYLKVELEALKMAMRSDEPEKHLRNALLFRKYRYQQFPGAKKSENSLEINEGLAEFTGSILSGRPKNELLKYYSSKIDWFCDIPTFVRSFAYFTIPVYGFFMRQTDSSWNLKIRKQTNLTDFILGFYKVPQTPVDKKEIMLIGKMYRIDSIIEFEQNREVVRLARIKKYKAQFLDDHVLKIKLENMGFGFNPGNLMPLDSLGTVYPTLRLTDNWGILEVDSCGALVSSDYKFVTVTCPKMITDTLLTGTGWKLKLNRNWHFGEKDKKNTLIKK